MSGRRSRHDWDRISALLADGLTWPQIVDAIGTSSSPTSLASEASRLRSLGRFGARAAVQGRRPKYDWPAIESEIRGGAPVAEVAVAHGMTPNALAAGMSNRRAAGQTTLAVGTLRRGKRGPYSDTERRRERLLAVRNSDNTAATEAAKRSRKAGRGRANVHAIDWHLIAPDGTHHECRNLYEFVRSNPQLFDEPDRAWKRTGGKRGTGGEWCNATAGLLNVRAGKARQWKGWAVL